MTKPPAASEQEKRIHFSLWGMIGVVTLYAGLLGLLRAYEIDLGAAIRLLVLVTGVLIARVVLFSGRHPRLSAMLGGGAVYVLFGLFFTEWSELATSLNANANKVTVAAFLFIVAGLLYLEACVLFGAILGLIIDIFLSVTSRVWGRLKKALASTN